MLSRRVDDTGLTTTDAGSPAIPSTKPPTRLGPFGGLQHKFSFSAQKSCLMGAVVDAPEESDGWDIGTPAAGGDESNDGLAEHG